jgi:Fe-Mn family superoxide dismutase
MQNIIKIVSEAENRRIKLVQNKLAFNRTDLAPVMSEKTLDYHFGKLAKAYVDRYNNKEGDDNFNYSGATLHNIFFAQFKPPSSTRPFGLSLELIDNKFKSFDNFKEEVEKIAMAIQGSGWVYMDIKGNLKTIKNHEYNDKMKIALLIDWWEHAWSLDYQSEKAKYLKNIWRIIDWSIVNNRLTETK